MSAAKRVQKLLREAEKRAMTKVDLGNKKVSERENMGRLMDGTKELQKEEVYIKATGRAIEKAMNIGKWFEAKDEYTTKVNTGSVLVVDDILEDEEKKQTLKERAASHSNNPDSKDSVVPSKKRKRRNAELNDDFDLPDSRTRWVNVVEIAVSMI